MVMDQNLFVSDKVLGSYVLDTAKFIKKEKDGSYANCPLVKRFKTEKCLREN